MEREAALRAAQSNPGLERGITEDMIKNLQQVESTPFLWRFWGHLLVKFQTAASLIPWLSYQLNCRMTTLKYNFL